MRTLQTRSGLISKVLESEERPAGKLGAHPQDAADVPNMAANLTTALMSFEDIVALIDAAAPKPGRPKTYKKRESA